MTITCTSLVPQNISTQECINNTHDDIYELFVATDHTSHPRKKEILDNGLPEIPKALSINSVNTYL